jgi:hypothetical protein
LNLYRYVRNNPFCYQDPDGHFALPFPVIVTVFKVTFGTAENCHLSDLFPALGATCACALVGYGCYQLCVYASNQIDTANEPETVKEDEENKEKFKFPKNPDDLMPELPRDEDGHIYPADNIRIRPEKHEMKLRDTYNPRHHGQHYHIETRRNPSGSWKKNQNIELIKPNGYEPGTGTGFLPGETFPGII